MRRALSLRQLASGLMTPLIYPNGPTLGLMRPSLGARYGAFALRSRELALSGHVVFSFLGCQFGSRRLKLQVGRG